MALFPLLFSIARSFFAPRLELMAEILALRQQLSILNRTAKRPSLRFQDRLFWIALSRFWRDWPSALLIVKPETVIKWHRQGFRLYARWKSKAGRPGRPRIDAEIRELIRRLSQENPLWGTPRILAELQLLGFEVAESTVAKYRINIPKPSSQTWKTFISNHAGTSLASISLLSPLRHSVSFTASSSFCMKDVELFISTSRIIQPPPGLRSK